MPDLDLPLWMYKCPEAASRKATLAKANVGKHVEKLNQHVVNLCEQHNIAWHQVRRGYAAYEFREIFAPPIRGWVSYAVVLHTIGHCLGRYQTSSKTMVRESWAWRWAKSHALRWTPAMERCAIAALGRRTGARSNPYKLTSSGWRASTSDASIFN